MLISVARLDFTRKNRSIFIAPTEMMTVNNIRWLYRLLSSTRSVALHDASDEETPALQVGRIRRSPSALPLSEYFSRF